MTSPSPGSMGPMSESEREQVAREHQVADLQPPINDDRELDEAVALGQRLAGLAETDPTHPLLVAARAALEVADARAAVHRAISEGTTEMAAMYDWAAVATQPSHDQLQRYRYPPDGDADAWVRAAG